MLRKCGYIEKMWLYWENAYFLKKLAQTAGDCLVYGLRP